MNFHQYYETITGFCGHPAVLAKAAMAESEAAE
jgi:hypothetical protein